MESGSPSAAGGLGPDAPPVPLAHRPDFALGAVEIRPARRTVAGPAGAAAVEPRVMQVLLALADHRDRVLTRDDLLRICWDGRIVGDDAVNRAVAEVRRVAGATGAGFAVETIPRVGYRLVVKTPDAAAQEPPAGSRRHLMALAAAGAAVAAGGGWIGWRRSRSKAVADLIRQGADAYHIGTAPALAQSAALLRQAGDAEPDNASAWGWLSLAELADSDNRTDAARLAGIERARAAASRALALSPRQPHARTALAVMRRGLDDWTRFEAELRQVLADSPDCTPAMGYLMFFLQGVGRCRDSWAVNERALALRPFTPIFQFRRAFKHWIFGRTDEADRVIDRARQLWPDHPLVWNARVIIYAFTGRPLAALRMVEDSGARPPLGKAAIAMWQASLRALDTRSPGDIARARERIFIDSADAPGVAANGVMVLSALGLADAAYELAEGFLMQRGLVVDPRTGATNDLYSEPTWRGTQWLFVPPTASFRADPRFTEFCRSVGFLRYWRQRGIFPDPFMCGSLAMGEAT